MPALPPRRVLVIEPEAALLAYLTQLLTQAGFTPTGALSGKEGLIEAWRQLPDLIVLETALPDMDGLTALRKLRADRRTAATPIIVFSSHSHPPDLAAAKQAGATSYIIKRNGADVELLGVVRDRLDAHSKQTHSLTDLLGHGKIITFVGSKGGAGVTTLCANLAHLLAQQVAPKTVGVIDLATPFGTLDYLAGVHAEAAPRVLHALRPDTRLLGPERLRSLMVTLPAWGFQLLPGFTAPDQALGLTQSQINALLAPARAAFDYVFIDAGRPGPEWLGHVLRQSNRVALTLGGDDLGVSLGKSTLKYLSQETVRLTRLFPVLNRATSVESHPRAWVERELGLSLMAVVPHASDAWAQSYMRHQPLDHDYPTATFTAILRELAQTLLTRLTDTAALTA